MECVILHHSERCRQTIPLRQLAQKLDLIPFILEVSQSIFLNAESAILFLRRICSYFFSTAFSSLASGKKGPGPFFVRVENQKFISATVTTVASNRLLIKTLNHHLDLPRFRVLIRGSWHCEKLHL